EMNILVVDDNAQVRRMLSSYLAKNGHQTEMANDGKQAWDLISQSNEAYDLIFTDIKMPVMNGLELLEKMRSSDLDIPVIIMTGYAVIELTLKAFKLGAYDFLTKPFEFDPLLVTLDKIESLRKNKQGMAKVSEFYEANVQFSIPSKLEYIKSLIPILQGHYKYLCEFYRKDIHSIASCIFEAVRNAILHGNLELDSEARKLPAKEFSSLIRKRESTPEFINRKVIIRAELNQKHLKFEVEDQGKGFDTASLPDFKDPESPMPDRKGLFIVYSNMDEVRWNEAGNCLTMIKHLQSK
ncbi:response regulator, partial [bacterium]|nr:response regulator [bacterium]